MPFHSFTSKVDERLNWRPVHRESYGGGALTHTSAESSGEKIRRRLRVLHVIDELGPGGAETLLWRLVNRPSDVDHEIVSLAGPDWYSTQIEEVGIPLRHLCMGSHLSVPAAVLALHRHIKRARPHVIQGWLYRSNIVAGLAARAAGVPVVWGIHCSSLEPLRPLSRLLVRASGRATNWLADFVVNCSTSSATLHAGLKFDAVPGRVIYNGYDPNRFFPDDDARISARAEFGIDPGTFVVGCISRWNPFKDIPNLLRAVELARRQQVPVRCLLIGRGLTEFNRELAEAIADCDVKAAVVTLGERADLPRIAAALDVHMLSSASEAFPNTVAETMLAGVPNIVTNVGDCAQIVGDSGWVAPPRDSGNLAASMIVAWREWSTSPSRWMKRQQRARQAIAERFTLQRMAEAYEEVWRGVSYGHSAQ